MKVFIAAFEISYLISSTFASKPTSTGPSGVKDVISYLIPSDSVGIIQHGCHCSQLGNNHRYKCYAIDELDQMCKAWKNNRHCLDISGHCAASLPAIYDHDVACDSQPDDCKRHACRIDTFYGGSMKILMDLGHALSGPVTEDLVIRDDDRDCNAERNMQCCGDFPHAVKFDANEETCVDGKLASEPEIPSRICPAGYACPAGVQNPNTYTICPVGTFSAEGPLICTPCPSGFTCPNEGMVGPLPGNNNGQGGICPAGYACPNGVTDPSTFVICSIGTYSTEGPLKCWPCPAGFSCPNEGMSRPIPNGGNGGVCPEGYSCPNGVTNPGTFVICPGGTYSAEGPLECTECPVSFYCPEGAGEPTPCNLSTHTCPAGSAAPQEISQVPACMTQDASWVEHSGHYFHISDDIMPWAAGKAYCENLCSGSYMVMPQNDEQNTAIVDWFKANWQNNGQQPGTGPDVLWYGYKRPSNGGMNDFDGANGQSMNWSNWCTVNVPIAEPNNYQNTEDCTLVDPRSGDEYCWSDVNCGNSYRVMCGYYGAPTVNPPAVQPQQPACIDSSWSQTSSGQYIRLSDNIMPWADAKAYCEGLCAGSQLAMPTSDAENEAVRDWAFANCYDRGQQPGTGHDVFWYGFQRPDNGGVNDFDRVDGQPMTWSSWCAPMEPNDLQDKEDCVFIDPRNADPRLNADVNSNYCWQDINCGNSYRAVCVFYGNSQALSTPTAAPQVQDPCMDGTWKQDSSGRYLRLSEGLLTWENAQDYCEGLCPGRSQMAMPTSDAENAAIRDWSFANCYDRGQQPGTGHDVFWYGFKRPNGGGMNDFDRTDGQAMSWTNWCTPEEPNNYDGNENCVFIDPRNADPRLDVGVDSNYCWQDINCGNSYRAVCTLD